MDFLAAGDGYRVGYAAAFRHDTRAALSLLDVPIVVASREDDLLFGHLDRLPQLPGGSRIVRLTADREAWGAALAEAFRAHAKETAPAVAPTLSRASLPKRSFIHSTNGAALVRSTNGGADRPLVLLHHVPGGSSDFDDAMLRHAGKRPIYAIDLPGCGDSESLASSSKLADYAAALAGTLDALHLRDADLAGDGIGASVALAIAHANPKRFAKVTVANVPRAGATPPPSFTPETYGEHLIRAWHTVRDDAMHGPWCARDPNERHRFGSELDTDGIHRRVVDTLKSVAPLDICRAALGAPLDRMRGNATVLPGMTPLAERVPI
jgi:pimeloyl-ACP methyl ester carboxylesterase